MSDPLRAAGGLVVSDGRVLLVHRRQYDDWAFPKGKLEEGETWEQAAVREVGEETGLHVELGEYVGSTRYPIREGEKEVRFFLMRADGEPRAQHEVDAVRWATPQEAAAILTYAYDRELLRKAFPPAEAG